MDNAPQALGLAHYQPFYCEENAWHLLRDPLLKGRAQEVWFISGAQRAVSMWGQRAASQPDAPVLWDYHVVVLADSPSGPQVWDPDHLMGCPSPALAWLDASFGPTQRPDFPAALLPRFRCFAAANYAAAFSSDRRHMLDERGEYLAPPPPWPALREDPRTAWCLGDWIDPGHGGAAPWLELCELLPRFGA